MVVGGLDDRRKQGRGFLYVREKGWRGYIME